MAKANLYFKQTSDGEAKAVEGENTGEIRIVICGKQAGGTITPSWSTPMAR